MPTYPYPVTNKFQALAVTEPSFEPELFGNEHQLYVNFDQVRDTGFASKVYFPLGIDEDQLMVRPNDLKIICSGHRGCGKTTELTRLHTYLNHPARYFSIFLSIEDETEYGSLQPEDIFVWILVKLVQAIQERGIRTSTTDFEDLTRQLFTTETIEAETKHKRGADLSAETGGGFDLLGFFKVKGEAKAVLASENSTSTKIREELRKNALLIIHKINAALSTTRQAVQAAGQGGDLLFIIDGSEKVRYEVYEQLFIRNANLLQQLAVNMVMAVPIDAYYKIEGTPAQNFSHQLIIPMIKLAGPDSEANRRFKEVIERRIDTDLFFEPGVLDECVRCSGGCMRQLLRVVNAVVRTALGARASLAVAQVAIQAEGRAMNELLTNKHLETLSRGLSMLRPADAEVREMLFQLVLLKYNGFFRLNPLLEGFIDVPA